jgi:glutathione S-transferase
LWRGSCARFLKISPEGRVPLIKLNGKYIPDSDVIVEALEKEVPCPPLSTCPKITCRWCTTRVT